MPESSPPDAGSSSAPIPWYRRRVLMASLSAFITLVCVIGIYAQQQGKAQQQTQQLADPASPAGLVLESQAKGTSLTAVGRVAGLSEHCTAWLLDTGAPADAQAVAVTTGRCVGITNSSQVIQDRDVTDATVDFDAFAPVTNAVPPTPVPAGIDRILWASTRWTDLALLRLDSSYGELAAAGVSPITPVATPAQGTAILVAGVPIEGVPPDQLFVRATRCSVGATVDVVEGAWLFSDARATDCTGVLGGSTGSPVFNPAGQAVAMTTSSTIAAKDPQTCGVGAPCEVDAGQVNGVPDTTYVLPVAGLASCWKKGELALSDQCPLEDPKGVAAATPAKASAAPGASVAITLDTDTGPKEVADKVGDLGSLDCSAADGWSDPVDADDWDGKLTVPDQGYALACVGSAAQPTPVLVRADAS